MLSLKNKCVFFDRDGILNKSIIKNGKPYAPLFFRDFKVYATAQYVVRNLKSRGYKIIVITNQPDINKKKLKVSEFKKMNNFLKKNILVDKIYFCPHLQSEKCSCRKPRIKLFKLAVRKYKINLNGSYMVGDRKTDISAGRLAGCKTIYVKKRYKEDPPFNQDYTVNNLIEILKIV